MFRILSLFLFISIIIGIILISKNRKGFWQDLIQAAKDILNQSKAEHVKRSTRIIISIKMIIYFILFVCVILLALSGFLQRLFLGAPPSGILLLIHVAVAPIFAVTVAVLALVWSHDHVFDKRDWRWLRYKFDSKKTNVESPDNYSTWQKILFWFGLALSFPVILSIVLGMFRYFGTYGQVYLFQIHRYCALFLVFILVSHTYFSLLRKN